MDASILLIGDREFLSHHLRLIHDLLSCSLETAPMADALSLIQAQQPDMVIIQAEQDGSWELCAQLRSQSRLTWIYCILVGSSIAESQVEEGSALSPVAQRDAATWTATIEIRGLNSGADAVVWRSPQSQDSQMVSSQALPGIGVQEAGESTLARNDLYGERLHAQIQAGLRRVQNHRELMRTNDLLSTIALSDPLTELNNRRAFEWELPRQIKNARANHAPISLVVLDVDFFKHINDNYGHLIGDRALHLIAARLRHNLRFCDIPFRYGGEEFVVILVDTDANDAFVVAQRICHLIAAQPFAMNDTLDLTITISAGTATLEPSDDERGISLLNRADQNLLKAKSQGRNRVVGNFESGTGEKHNSYSPGKRRQNSNCDCCDPSESRP